MAREYVVEAARRVPVCGAYDVAVVGGGIAGVAAAVAAARNGARVCLVEKENAPGGLATLGLIAYYLPLCDGLGHQVIGGLGEELLKLSVKYGPGEIPAAWRGRGSVEQRRRARYQVMFNPASFLLALAELLRTSGVHILYDTRFCDVRMNGRRIAALLVENKGGRGAIRCRQVVDASGDADVCARAGEPTVSLRTNGRSWWFYAWQEGTPTLHARHDPFGELRKPGQRCYAGDDAADVSEMSIQAHSMILNDIRRLARGEGFKSVYPLLAPSIPLFRMTRRLRGALELDLADEGRAFPDTVGLTGDWRNPGPVFALPFRCLHAVRTDNLVTAGRCISCSAATGEITRAIPACAVTGEAAGTAAALACRGNGGVAALDVAALRQKLLQQRVILRGA